MDGIHPIIEATLFVMVASLGAPIPQHANHSSELRVVGSHRASLTVGAEVLAWVKTEAPQMSDAAGATALVFSSMGLCSILDDNELMSARDVQNGVHIHRPTVEMNG